METQARFVVVGLFTVAVVVVGFFVVYWIQNTGSLTDRVSYRVRYAGSAPGLRSGAPVLFNGITVGSVTAVSLDQARPDEVMASISVDRHAPVRADTKVGIARQGLLGEASMSLSGGSGTAPPGPAADGGPAELTADAAASQDFMEAARDTIQEIGKLVGDNADTLHTTFTNLSQFSDALARNSSRIDTILAGLEKLTGGGGSKSAPKGQDLTAPVGITLAKIPTSQLVVADPVVPASLDTQRIEPASDEGPSSSDAQWVDSIPKLVQTKIVQGFENANYLRVGRPSDNLTADYQLLLEIRTFEVSTKGDPTANVVFTAKVVGNGGTISDARIFKSSAPVRAPGSAGAAAALDEAFGRSASDLVTWVCGLI